MLKSLVEAIRAEISGSVALDYVAGISRFHRIQASPGYRQAAHWCAERLREAGLDVDILSYPARPSQTYWGQVMFQEWACEEAVLRLVSPAAEARRLCDFRENALSVIQRSTSTPPGGLRGEVVVIDKADDPASYEGLDVAGKFVLFTGDAQRTWEIAGAEKGAIALVTDQMTEFAPVRKAMDLPAATQYTSFRHAGPKDRPAIGFVLSPAEGARLRHLVREKRGPAGQSRDPVVLEAQVKASLYDGAIENVAATIPGARAAGSGGDAAASRDADTARDAGGQEVLLVAHLCHPKPSANDNASGSGTLMETARALQALVTSGRLPRPRRAIRFLLVPEMTGTYAYLATNETAIGRIVAALNLDMVGENQGLCGGALQIECPPLACPDFTGDLLTAIADAVADEAGNFGGTARYGLFARVRTPFSGGSDHYILSDPTVGVPCPMLIQFPDRFYHTSADTLDKVDPAMLARVATMAAAYLYFLASAGPREAAWLAGVMAGNFVREASRLAEQETSRSATSPGRSPLFARRLAFLAERKREGLRALARTFANSRPQEPSWLTRLGNEIQAAAAREEERAAALAADLASAPAGMTVGGPSSPADSGGGSASAPPPNAASAGAPLSGVGPPEPGPDNWAELKDLVPRRLYRGPVDPRSALCKLSAERRAYWHAFGRKHERARSVEAQLVYWMDGRRSLAEVADYLELETGFRDDALVAGYVPKLVECGLLELKRGASSR